MHLRLNRMRFKLTLKHSFSPRILVNISLSLDKNLAPLLDTHSKRHIPLQAHQDHRAKHLSLHNSREAIQDSDIQTLLDRRSPRIRRNEQLRSVLSRLPLLPLLVLTRVGHTVTRLALSIHQRDTKVLHKAHTRLLGRDSIRRYQ